MFRYSNTKINPEIFSVDQIIRCNPLPRQKFWISAQDAEYEFNFGIELFRRNNISKILPRGVVYQELRLIWRLISEYQISTDQQMYEKMHCLVQRHHMKS